METSGYEINIEKVPQAGDLRLDPESLREENT